MKKNNNYIDKAKFYEEIVKHHQKCQEAEAKGLPRPRLSNYIGKCIYDIAENFSHAPNFMNYSFREEMVGDAVEVCLKYFYSYKIDDPSRNPFGYFTQVVWRAFVSRIGEEEKKRYTLYKNFEETIVHGGLGDLMIDDENNLLTTKTYDNISEFISNYERKEREKRLLRIERKKQREIDNAKSNSDTGTDSDATSGTGEPERIDANT